MISTLTHSGEEEEEEEEEERRRRGRRTKRREWCGDVRFQQIAIRK
jgi:hypothetical protein